MATTYSELLRALVAQDGGARLAVPEDWMQGRSVFGGLQAAIALGAMRSVAPPAPLRTLQGTCVAPVPGGEVQARAQVLRTGKSATHVEARIVDGAATLAIFTAVFGTPRASSVRIQPAPAPVEGEQRLALPRAAGVAPSFTQHFEPVWRRGLPPFTGDTQTRHVIELAMRDPGPVTEAHLLAIADFIPPLGLSHLRAPAPGSTLTWMIELLRQDFAGLPPGGWRLDAELVAAQDGYTSQSVRIWAPDNTLAALSRQSMVIFG